MKKKSTETVAGSRPEWNEVEAWVRGKVQGLIQDVLEEEVTEFLGRGRSQRCEAVDASAGYRNGHGKPRRVTLSSGTIAVRRPRVRETAERFESRVLPLFQRASPGVKALLPELSLHGLAAGDLDLALRGLLGEKAPVSASTVMRLKEKWEGELAAWRSQDLGALEPVYLWVDGIYVKAGLEKEKAAMLVVLAALSDGRKVVLAVTAGHRESESGWAEVFRDLKGRGLKCPKLLVGDGHLGAWAALRAVYPESAEQRCWNHKIVNVLNKVPKAKQPAARGLLCPIPYAATIQEAETLKAQFSRWCEQHACEDAAKNLDKDWARLVTFYRFPKEHWQHIRTTNPIESPFAAVRLRTDAAKRFKKVNNATAVIWKVLMIGQRRFRALKHPELAREVYRGANFVDGVTVKQEAQEQAAA